MNKKSRLTPFITILCIAVFYSCNKPVQNVEFPVQKEMSDSELFDSNESLTRCSLYNINETSPQFRQIADEGNIAYYGLLLAAGPDMKLARKLISANRDGLWEYHKKYGVTSEDSALVIEGLLASGVDKDILLKALSALSEKFYDSDNGCFRTVNGGRADYWKGCSVETTAHIAYLMYKVDPEKFANEIEASAKYTSSNQTDDGKWDGRWFPSFTIPSYYAVRFLALFGEKFSGNIEKSLSYLKQTQTENGSWNNSIIETSAAILLINCSGKQSETLAKAGAWLKNTMFKAEPILYYWFDNGNGKLFFDCWDKGHISTAWKKLAIKSLP
ncbi:MAG TPA: terpene cyclase/mutase family protein [bacterium]|nr:terpene cyclase/mutase family protein [bacterium]HPS29680.1 terpene cyclase/mutase family protein [bacterium]